MKLLTLDDGYSLYLDKAEGRILRNALSRLLPTDSERLYAIYHSLDLAVNESEVSDD